MQKNQYSQLEKAILATLSYFDIFDYPLTAIEIFKWVYKNNESINANLYDIQRALDGNNLKRAVGVLEGFYFLKDKEENVSIRKRRYNLAESKYKRATRVAKIFRIFPFIQMVGVCNSLAFNNPTKESDIDFFVIADKDKIWTTRFITTTFTKVFRLRPTKEKIENKICLSYFVTQEALDLENTKISDQDPYLHYWISQVVPIYDPENVYKEFIKENEWIKKSLSQTFPVQLVERRKATDSAITKPLKNILTIVLKPQIFENVLRKIQIRIMPSNLKAMANQDSRVVVTNSQLKFHDSDRREQFEKSFQEKLFSVINE